MIYALRVNSYAICVQYQLLFSWKEVSRQYRKHHLCLAPDLFIAHNAVPEGATGVERQLHMPPSVIGQIAQQAHVKRLVLSHRMLRTLSKEAQSLSEIRKNFSGPVAFANDLDCFPVP